MGQDDSLIIKKGTKVNFSEIDKINFNLSDISDCELTGLMSKAHIIGRTNISRTLFSEFKAEGIDFTDIKDSSFKVSTFVNSTFNDSALMNNLIHDCIFDNCSFNMTSINGSIFFSTTFEDCDFSNLIINTCKFYNCKFNNCKTTNKLMEYCLILDSRFKKTELQKETITLNFGLTLDCLEEVRFRTNSSNHSYSYVSPEEFKNDKFVSEYEIDNFKIQYFLTPEILSIGHEYFDEIYKIENWLRLCRIPNTFKSLIELLCDFLIYQFENSRLPLFGIQKIHLVIKSLIDNIEKADLAISTTLAGLWLNLGRIIFPYEELANQLTRTAYSDGFVTFLVEGPLDRNFYLNKVEFLMESSSLRIIRIEKQNSPNWLTFCAEFIKDYYQIILLFVSVQPKFRLEFIKRRNIDVSSEEIDNSKVDKSLFSIETFRDSKTSSSLLYQSFYLSKSIEVLFDFGLNTKVLGECMKIFVGIFDKAKN